MKIIRDEIDKFFDCDIDIQTRTLYMGSVSDTSNSDGDTWETGTDYQMAEHTIKGLHILDNKGKKEPITIIMNNLGGDEYHGLGMYDAIKCCQNIVVVKVFGQTMSMGSWILQAADERLMSPNSTMMIHHGNWGSWDRHENSMDFMMEAERLNEVMRQHYLERMNEVCKPKWTQAKLKKYMARRDVYLTAEQALKLGLIDSIIGYPEH